MAVVESVRGPVDLGSLGQTLMHEHVFVLSTEHVQNYGPGLLIDIPEPMVTDFSHDITEGIAGTGVKAAFLKCCMETAELTAGVERIARAIARTHLETGAPITVHTSGPYQGGRTAVRIFTEEGVDLSKVMIGHAGDSNDLDYLTELADSGVLLGMDRFGLDLFNPGTERIKTIAALAARGYAASMVLAHDANCFIDYFGAAHDEVRAAAAPNWHYEHISDDVLPALLDAGVTQAQIDTMLIENPVRYFTPAKGGAA